MKQGVNLKLVLLRSAGIALVAAVAWYLMIRPMRVEVARLRSAIAQQEETIRAEKELALVVADQDEQRLRNREKALRKLIAASSKSTRWYDAIGALADSSRVKVMRLDPTRSARQRDADRGGGFTSEGYRIDVQGDYRAIMSFLDGVEHELGLSKVLGFHMTPYNDPAGGGFTGMLVASIETVHYTMLPEAAGESPVRQAGVTEGGS